MKNLTQKALHGTAWITGSQGVQAVFQLLIIAILARILDPREFGLMATAMIVIGFAEIFTKIGIGPALVQKKELSAQDLDTGFTLGVAMGGAVVALFILVAPWVAGFFGQAELLPMLQVLAWVFLLKSFAIVPLALLQRRMRFKQYSLLQLVSYVVGSLVTVGLALNGAGVWALVYGYCLQAGIHALVLLPYMRAVQFGYTQSSALHIVNFGFGLSLAMFFNYAAKNVDYFIVGKLLGPTALGFYSRAYALIQKVSGIVGSGLNKSLFPVIAGIQGDLPRVARGYRRMVAVIALTMIPVSVVGVLLAPEIVHVLLGPEWDATIMPFQVLVAGLVCRTGYKSSDTLSRAIGAVYRRAWRQGVYAVLTFLGALFGLKLGGLVGVAAGVTLAMACNYLLMAQLSLKLVPLDWKDFLRVHLPGVFFGLIVLLATWPAATLMRAQDFNSFIVLLVASAVASLTFIVSVVTMPASILGADGMFGVNLIREKYLQKIFDRTFIKK